MPHIANRRGAHLRAALVLPLLCGALAACSDLPPGPPSFAGYQGFDTSLYPGDATMAAWRPASPYDWTGYYLPAPCHKDASWSGRRAALEGMGWGIAAIYVGQQEWEGVPNLIPWPTGVLRTALPDRYPVIAEATAPTCSRTLLSTAQGTSEGQDAAARMAAEGFLPGSTVYLDVEYMTTVEQTMRDYVGAWIAAVLADGRYLPGIYVAKRNADEIRSLALSVYSAAGRGDEPRFWIASSTGFDRADPPTAVGLSYADVWQGLFDRSESWGGAAVTIDVDVASMVSPSDPPSVLAARAR